MALTTQTIRRLLRLCAATFLAGSGVLIWRMFVSPTISVTASNEFIVTVPQSIAQTPRLRAVHEFAPFLKLTLGQSINQTTTPGEASDSNFTEAPRTTEDIALEQTEIEDEVIEEAAVEPPLIDSATLGLRLIGTMIEASQSIAILADSHGDVRLAEVGDSITTDTGKGTIDQIELHQIQFSIGGNPITLKVAQ